MSAQNTIPYGIFLNIFLHDVRFRFFHDIPVLALLLAPALIHNNQNMLIIKKAWCRMSVPKRMHACTISVAHKGSHDVLVLALLLVLLLEPALIHNNQIC
jgi:hypothetical protein